MATTSSFSPTSVERSGSSRRGQSYSAPTRSQSTRTKNAVPPTSSWTSSSHHRTSSRHGAAAEDQTPQGNYESSNIAQSSRRSSSQDRPLPSRAESARSASSHHRSRHHRRDSSDMSTAVANGGSPAPVLTATESRHTGGKSGRSRTTIPAQTGNWVLGKTIGAGSMGKVKLARRAEGGEQVSQLHNI